MGLLAWDGSWRRIQLGGDYVSCAKFCGGEEQALLCSRFVLVPFRLRAMACS